MLFRSSKSEPATKSDATGGTKVPSSGSAAQAKPSPDRSAEIKQRAAKSKQLQASFGEIVGLLMRTPQYKGLSLSSLENLVVPAIATGQFMIAEARAKESGLIAPVAAVLWAMVSEDVDRRLSQNGARQGNLAVKDWKSGEIPWLIVAAGDQRLVKVLLQRIEKTVLKGRPLKSTVKEEGDNATAPVAATS